MRKSNSKQKLTLAFLQKMEKENKNFSAEQLSEASTYPLQASLYAKLSRNEFGKFIIKTKGGLYKAQNTIGISEDDYALKVSSKYRHANPVKYSTSNVSENFSNILLEKSVQAVVAAIEIYNKPDFGYREDAFSILLVNAWEVLLKAKILLDAGENMEVLYIPNKEKPGEFVKSRTGSYRTISIGHAIKKLNLDNILIDNLLILIEIRDTAIHFVNKNSILHIKLQEIGTASLQSYLNMCKNWFDKDLSKYNFFIMPMSFFHVHEFKSYSINSDSVQNQNLIRYIWNKEKEHSYDPLKEHNISLTLETKFVKSKMQIDPSNPDAIPIMITDDDKFTKIFIWSCKEHLIPHLQKRYNNFKVNKSFWSLLRKIKLNPKLCQISYLNTKTKRGGKQEWYNPSLIITEFDKHYTQVTKKKARKNRHTKK